MDDRISMKSDQQIVSTEAGLAVTIGCASRRPVGGEVFFLTAPFIEHYGVFWRVIFEKAHGRIEFKRYPFSTLGEVDGQ
jgi:hypothetical protein